MEVHNGSEAAHFWVPIPTFSAVPGKFNSTIEKQTFWEICRTVCQSQDISATLDLFYWTWLSLCTGHSLQPSIRSPASKLVPWLLLVSLPGSVIFEVCLTSQLGDHVLCIVYVDTYCSSSLFVEIVYVAGICRLSCLALPDASYFRSADDGLVTELTLAHPRAW